MNRDFEVAAERAQGACDLCSDEDAASWVALGDVAHATNRIEDAAEAYSRAVSVANAAAPEVPELRTLVRLGALCLQLSRTDAAKDVFLQGVDVAVLQHVARAGIAFLRLGALGDSEAALQEANVRNNENAVVWGYICLLCLNVGGKRLEQANRAQAVAARLGLADSTLLRELANAYTEITASTRPRSCSGAAWRWRGQRLHPAPTRRRAQRAECHRRRRRRVHESDRRGEGAGRSGGEVEKKRPWPPSTSARSSCNRSAEPTKLNPSWN